MIPPLAPAHLSPSRYQLDAIEFCALCPACGSEATFVSSRVDYNRAELLPVDCPTCGPYQGGPRAQDRSDLPLRGL